VRLITAGPFRGLPEHRAGCLYVDPPWRFDGFTADPGDRAPPYPTMPMADIAALPVSDLAARDCWLFCWTSGPYLKHTLDIIEGWGFSYSSVAFTWVKLTRAGDKLHRGLGKTTRKNTEQVLLAKIGAPRILCRPDELLISETPGPDEVCVTPLREHSRKPDEIRDRVAEMAAGPRLELFARQRFTGWQAWGNQTNRWAPMRGGEDENVDEERRAVRSHTV
jgi:N6-adenosine-specific RNA methylase IME4